MADEPNTPAPGTEPPAPPPTPEPPATPPPAPPTEDAPSPATGDPAPTDPPPAKGAGTDWKAEADKWKGYSRKHEDASKATRAELDAIKATQEQQRDAFAKALGLKPDDTPPDPAKLAAEARESQAARDQALADARQARVEKAVTLTALDLGADPRALDDSRTFLASVKELDPGADDFAERLKEAVTAAVEANPKYKLTAPAPAVAPKPTPTIPKSGGEFNGSPGAGRQWTEDDAKNATPQEVSEAIEKGWLIDLGFHPKRSKR